MKKILCLIISIILIFSLAACDRMSDNGKKPASTPIIVASPTPAPTSEDMNLLGPALEDIEASSKIELGDNVMKMTTSIVTDVVYTGMAVKTSEQTVAYTKDTADSKILSQETKEIVPTQPEEVSSLYFENDYMYVAADADVTIKFESPVDNVLDSVWEESFIDISTLADIARDATVNVDAQGKYEIIIEIDVTKDSEYIDNFVSHMIDEKTASNLTKCTVKITTTEDSFMNSISIELKASQDRSDVGTVHITSEIDVTVDILAPEYKIPVPAGIDVENAMTQEEYLEKIYDTNPTVENFLSLINYKASVAYDNKTINTVMKSETDVIYDNQSARQSMDVFGYVKYTDEDAVVSLEYTFDDESEGYSIYYIDGYLYLSYIDETYKYEASFEDIFSHELSMEIENIDDILDASKDAYIEKQGDGSFNLYITVDTAKESTFVSSLIKEMSGTLYTPSINSYTVFYHVTEDYLVHITEIQYNVSGQDIYGYDVNLIYNYSLTAEIMDDNYVIQPPKGVDIDNAITDGEYI